MDPIVVLFSGGINSTVAACRVMDGVDLHLLFVRHGQAAVEMEASHAARVAEALAATLHIANLPADPETTCFGSTEPSFAKSRSPADGASPIRTPGTMLVMIGTAQRLAERVNAREIVSGASEVCNESEPQLRPGAAHPDMRHAFLHAADIALEMGSPPKKVIKLDIPFVDLSRGDIVRLGRRIGAPLHLTWYCLRNGPKPCNECPGCVCATEALAAADTVGPASLLASRR